MRRAGYTTMRREWPVEQIRCIISDGESIESAYWWDPDHDPNGVGAWYDASNGKYLGMAWKWKYWKYENE